MTVKHMLNQHPALDSVFRALSDSTRRAIVERLTGGPISVSSLAEPLAMSLPAVMQHLAVLERAGLIARGREAQWRPCRIEPAALKSIDDWLGHYRRFWEERFDRLDHYLKELQANAEKPEQAKGKKKNKPDRSK